jgi:hypothetical protein
MRNVEVSSVRVEPTLNIGTTALTTSLRDEVTHLDEHREPDHVPRPSVCHRDAAPVGQQADGRHHEVGRAGADRRGRVRVWRSRGRDGGARACHHQAGGNVDRAR